MDRKVMEEKEKLTKVRITGWEKNVMFSLGQILLEIYNAIAIMTQTWVGEKCEVFTS